MLNTSTQTELLERLHKTQSLILALQENLRKAEAIRDLTIRHLGDHEGCDDRRFAVR